VSEAEILAAVAEEIKRGDARSLEYQRGMAAVLRYRARGVRIPCPYRLGTAEADAYFSGNERGHALWRKMRESGERP
jgi:hypothetical protein